MDEVAFPVEVIAGIPVVRTCAEIDVTNAPELQAALAKAAARGDGTLVVDMSQTRYCDTSGLSALIVAHKHAQADGGTVLLVISSAFVARVFAITGAQQVFPHFASLEAALAAAHAGAGSDIRDMPERDGSRPS